MGNEIIYQWAINFIFGMYLMASLTMILATIVKFIWDSMRGLATTLVVISLGASICGQCVVSVLLRSYYHNYEEYYNEFRYATQFYGNAYYIALAGLIGSTITLASILGEEPDTSYLSPKKSAVYDADQYGTTSLSRAAQPRMVLTDNLHSTANKQ